MIEKRSTNVRASHLHRNTWRSLLLMNQSLRTVRIFISPATAQRAHSHGIPAFRPLLPPGWMTATHSFGVDKVSIASRCTSLAGGRSASAELRKPGVQWRVHVWEVAWDMDWFADTAAKWWQDGKAGAENADFGFHLQPDYGVNGTPCMDVWVGGEENTAHEGLNLQGKSFMSILTRKGIRTAPATHTLWRPSTQHRFSLEKVRKTYVTHSAPTMKTPITHNLLANDRLSPHNGRIGTRNIARSRTRLAPLSE